MQLQVLTRGIDAKTDKELSLSNKQDNSEENTNYGKLKGKVPFRRNIVYYRRGLEELSLNITNACPNACTFCIRDRDAGWGVSNLYMVEDPTIKEIIEAFNLENKKIKATGIKLKKVKICGYGEPILRFEDLFPILRHIKANSLDTTIQLTTTGWPYFRLTNNKTNGLRELKKAGLTDVYLSLNATEKETYRKLVRPGVNQYDSEAFEDSVRFGISCKDAGLKVTLGFINLEKISKEVKLFADRLGLPYKIRELEK